MKKRIIIKLIILVVIIFLPFFFFFILPNYTPTFAPQVAHKILVGPYKGNYLVTDWKGEIQIISPNSQVLWKTDECAFFVHNANMMPDGNSIIVADTGNDRVFIMNLSNYKVIWEWYAFNATAGTYMDYWNWTKFAIQQGWNRTAIDIVENFHRATLNQRNPYYTHLNQAQYLNGTIYGRPYDSILVSLRNFDMIIEINYSAKQNEPGYMNITWHYGIPGNHSILYHPHSPTRWSNGHVTICDSQNIRIVEIDGNNNIVWIYTDKNLRWPRDCKIMPNGNYLITDSSNNRIIEVNRSTEQIVRTFTNWLLVVPYHADYVEEDNQIITGANQQVLIFDYATGNIVNTIGFWSLYAPFIISFLIIIAYQLTDVVLIWRKLSNKPRKYRLRMHQIYSKIILIGILVGSIFILNYIIAFLWFYSGILG